MATLVERVESLEAEIEHLKSLLEGGSQTESFTSTPKSKTFTRKMSTTTKPKMNETVSSKMNPLDGAAWLLDETGGTDHIPEINMPDTHLN